MKKINNPIEYIKENFAMGVKSRKHPFHLGAVSYLQQDNSPHVCYVVLRDFNFDESYLRFNSDVRTSKISSFSKNNKSEIMFYDSSIPVQIRLSGAVRVERDNITTQKQWNEMQDMSKECYRQPKGAGEIFDQSNKILSLDEAYKNFCMVFLDIKLIDILVLDHNRNQRLIINLENKENKENINITEVYP